MDIVRANASPTGLNRDRLAPDKRQVTHIGRDVPLGSSMVAMWRREQVLKLNTRSTSRSFLSGEDSHLAMAKRRARYWAGKCTRYYFAIGG